MKKECRLEQYQQFYRSQNESIQKCRSTATAAKFIRNVSLLWKYGHCITSEFIMVDVIVIVCVVLCGCIVWLCICIVMACFVELLGLCV